MLRFLAAGGFGDIWLARERVTGVRRVVKVLHKSDAQRAAREIQGVRRYQQSAHNHAHLIQILTVGETALCFYYVMEAADNSLASPTVPGIGAQNSASPPDEYAPTTLRTLMSARGSFSGRDALEMLRKLLTGVARLHEQGLAHFDLKPENILIVEGEPKIADVGLVGLKHEPPPYAGTPCYMTPQGHADDLYALGRVLYELVTGQAATGFPRVPADLPARATPELSAALKIIHRACRTDARRRYSSVEELAGALKIAQRAGRGLPARWRRLSRGQKWLGAAVATVGVALAVMAGDAVHRRLVPHLLEAWSIPLDSRAFKLAHEWSVPNVGSSYPYLRLAGVPLERAGQYVHRLPRPLRNFIVDARVVARRPWGQVSIVLLDEHGETKSVEANLYGQPDGLGLLTNLKIAGAPEDPARLIVGHPLPGVEYAVRLARVNDTIQLALWPLAVASCEPIRREARLPDADFRPQTLALDAGSGDPRAELDLLRLTVSEYSAPLDKVEAAHPAEVGSVHAALLPPIPDDRPAPFGELLAAPWHPYDSDAWMAVGHCAWWSEAVPTEVSKAIRCTPASRDSRRRFGLWNGLQTLRFDEGRYGDCEVRLRVRLADSTDPATAADDPFPYDSETGSVGLVLRLGDAIPPDCAWGGGYAFHVGVGKQPTQPPQAELTAFSGMRLNRRAPHLIEQVDGRVVKFLRLPTELHALLVDPHGFTLRARCVGDEFTFWLNDEEILTASGAGGPAEGRLGISVGKMIATFEALEVTPIP